MAILGWIDVVHPRVVGGWTLDDERPDSFLSVELLVDGRAVGEVTANAYRNELGSIGGCDPFHAFHFDRKDLLNLSSQIEVRVKGTDNILPWRPDPIPFPPDELVYSVVSAGGFDIKFLGTGAADCVSIEALLRDSGSALRAGARLLDWGCGCGRIARHWLNRGVDLYGCDINEDGITWSQKNLAPGKFAVSGLMPPLPYPNDHFDALFGISVLTHLLFDTHMAWIAELWRVLKPGGVAVLTAQGPAMFPTMAYQIAGGYRAITDAVDEGMFVGIEHVEGSNDSGNMVTQDVLGKMFYPFRTLDYRPCYGLMGIQDSYVFYKPSAACLKHIFDALSISMSGTRFVTDLPVPAGTIESCSLFVSSPDLIHPTKIRAEIDYPGTNYQRVASASKRLQEKSSWTGLRAAHTCLQIDGLPLTDATPRVRVIVSSSQPLDGVTLEVRHAAISLGAP